MKHTPGPWKIDDHDRVILGDIRIEQFHSKGISGETRFANARLIASAPDLLEALINLVNIVNELDFTGYDTKGEDPSEWTKQAIAAIAKAGVSS